MSVAIRHLNQRVPRLAGRPVINVLCPHDFHAKGTPVRRCVGAAMS